MTLKGVMTTDAHYLCGNKNRMTFVATRRVSWVLRTLKKCLRPGV